MFWKDENKEKEAGMALFKKNCSNTSTLAQSNSICLNSTAQGGRSRLQAGRGHLQLRSSCWRWVRLSPQQGSQQCVHADRQNGL